MPSPALLPPVDDFLVFPGESLLSRVLSALCHHRLAPVGDPAFRQDGTYRAHRRPPIHSLQWPRWSSSLLQKSSRSYVVIQMQKEHRLRMWCRWEDRYSPGNWASGNSALTIARGACGARTYTSSAHHRFPQQALFPSAFQLQVGWVLQEPPSEFFPVGPGDTIKRDTAHT